MLWTCVLLIGGYLSEEVFSEVLPRSPLTYQRTQFTRFLPSILTATGITTLTPLIANAMLGNDEFSINFTTSYLGLVLAEEEYKGATRITVKDIKPDAEGSKYTDKLRGTILVSIGGSQVEGLSLSDANIGSLVKNAPRPLLITFRDPNIFFQFLQSNKTSTMTTISQTTEDTSIMSTVIRPATKNNEAQVLKVEVFKVSGVLFIKHFLILTLILSNEYSLHRYV
jgi:hypothetical protein